MAIVDLSIFHWPDLDLVPGSVGVAYDDRRPQWAWSRSASSGLSGRGLWRASTSVGVVTSLICISRIGLFTLLWGSPIDLSCRPYNRSALPCCLWWRLYCVRVRQRRDAALFPNYFGQTCYYYYYYFIIIIIFVPSVVKISRVTSKRLKAIIIIYCYYFYLAVTYWWEIKIDIRHLDRSIK